MSKSEKVLFWVQKNPIPFFCACLIIGLTIGFLSTEVF